MTRPLQDVIPLYYAHPGGLPAVQIDALQDHIATTPRGLYSGGMNSDYEKKFGDFIRLCAEAKATGATQVTVANTWVLGDNYEELIESLSRLAEDELLLQITSREPRPDRN